MTRKRIKTVLTDKEIIELIDKCEEIIKHYHNEHHILKVREQIEGLKSKLSKTDLT